MKRFSFKIDQRQVDQFFKPIRHKCDVIVALMRTVKIVIIGEQAPEEYTSGEITLIKSKMSRLFFFTENKYFSVNFPFNISESDGQIFISSRRINEIDNKLTSDIISLFSDADKIKDSELYEFFEPIMELADTNPSLWALVQDLLLFEDGYLRYDYDEDHVNGDIHPLNHYDIFYSSDSTFKIGLRDRISKETIIDMVEAETNCHFIS
ncbi:hypothetical protein [Endozoicomonas sp. YOMI1]|uniref:hypothetical protein n=1 Tax=Endozoicomonas sp. YOMI1 TaxID=2828739 RepID=UPI00214950DF|nr:hypothetical protein [Endozoicomonas sp. YOMI1]